MSPEGLATLLKGLADQLDTHSQTLRLLAEEMMPPAPPRPPALDLLACYFIVNRKRIWDRGGTIRTFAVTHGVSPKDLYEQILTQDVEGLCQQNDPK